MNVRNYILYLIRNSNPHILITRLNNTRWLLLFLLLHFSLIKSKFLVLILRSNSAEFFYIKIFFIIKNLL